MTAASPSWEQTVTLRPGTRWALERRPALAGPLNAAVAALGERGIEVHDYHAWGTVASEWAKQRPLKGTRPLQWENIGVEWAETNAAIPVMALLLALPGDKPDNSLRSRDSLPPMGYAPRLAEALGANRAHPPNLTVDEAVSIAAVCNKLVPLYVSGLHPADILTFTGLTRLKVELANLRGTPNAAVWAVHGVWASPRSPVRNILERYTRSVACVMYAAALASAHPGVTPEQRTPLLRAYLGTKHDPEWLHDALQVIDHLSDQDGKPITNLLKAPYPERWMRPLIDHDFDWN